MIELTYNWNDDIITEIVKSQSAATKRVQEIYDRYKNQDWFYLHKEILKQEQRVDDKKKEHETSKANSCTPAIFKI